LLDIGELSVTQLSLHLVPFLYSREKKKKTTDDRETNRPCKLARFRQRDQRFFQVISGRRSNHTFRSMAGN